MCKASHAVARSIEAAANSTLSIGTVNTHAQDGRTVGAMHALGETTASCVHCLQTGARLTISNIPATLQKEFGLRKTEVATFLQHPEWHKDDQLVFDHNKATVDLKRFADQGVEVYVGVRAHDTTSGFKTLADAAANAKGEDDGTSLAAREREHA